MTKGNEDCQESVVEEVLADFGTDKRFIASVHVSCNLLISNL